MSFHLIEAYRPQLDLFLHFCNMYTVCIVHVETMRMPLQIATPYNITVRGLSSDRIKAATNVNNNLTYLSELLIFKWQDHSR